MGVPIPRKDCLYIETGPRISQDLFPLVLSQRVVECNFYVPFFIVLVYIRIITKHHYIETGPRISKDLFPLVLSQRVVECDFYVPVFIVLMYIRNITKHQ